MDYRKYTRKNLSSKFKFFSNLSVTNWFILINVIFFIVVNILVLNNQNFFEYIALKSSNILQGKYLWTLLTSMFMHGSFAHILVNMVSLMFIGNFVERIIGRKRFFWFYLVSGLVASLFFVLFALVFSSELNVYAVGASGAIFALGGLLMILTPKLPVLVFFIIPMRMFTAMIFLLAMLWVLSVVAGLPIGNTAHLGGLLSGIVYGLYLKRKYKRKVVMLNRMFG